MNSSISHWFKGHLKDVPRDECLELLASRQVGRIVFTDPDGPVALPVNYMMQGDRILISTLPDGTVARHATGRVAFEIDELDEFIESGWSVLVRGSASEVSPGDVLIDRPDPWAEGPRTLLLQITPEDITGRRLFSP